MNREPSDAQLLRRLDHDAEALRAFYLRHVRAVTRFLARRCRTPEDLADAVAQTFVEVIGSAFRYDAARGNALDARLDASRLRQPLSDALDSLAPAEREIVELVDIDGLAPSDAARVLGISPAAARMRLARGRRRLRAALAVDAPDAVQA